MDIQRYAVRKRPRDVAADTVSTDRQAPVELLQISHQQSTLPPLRPQNNLTNADKK